MEYKTPASIYEYIVDWSTELGTDTIATSAWDVETGLTEDSESETSTTTTIFVSGGTAGTTYKLTNTITSTLRTYEQSFFLKVQDQIFA